MYERDRAHDLFVKTKDPAWKTKYKNLRNRVTATIRRNKYSYFDNINATCNGNPCKFWKEIKNVLPKLNPKSIPKSLTADEFNAYFTTIPLRINAGFGDNDPSKARWKGPQSIHTFTLKHVAADAVLRLLQAIPDKTGNDILGIDRKLMRIAAQNIAHSLSVIINTSIDQGNVHEDWKVARVTPVYKNGEATSKNNYRPISVIGHVAKILERLIQNQLLKYLEVHCFISPDQSAFLARHSTQTSLHRAVDDWLENVNENQITGAILLDISKCFDVIDHSLLLRKLNYYGIRGKEYSWFKSYLNGRRQAVTCHGTLSQFLDVDTGVPQGSVLGPFLFLLFINDVTNCIPDGGVSNLFADDNFIYVACDTLSEVQHKLQNILDAVSEWYKSNRLMINTDKTKIMLIGSRHQLQTLRLDDFTIKYDGNVLELVNKAKYLGIYISSDLTWDVHVQYMCKQLHYYVSLLRRLSNIFPRSILLKIYKAYIQPRFDYGVTVWGSTTEGNLNKIQRIQNLAARILTGNYDFINYRGIDLVKSLKLFNIRERRDYFLCVLIFKSIHGLAPYYLSDRVDMNFDILGYNTRSTHMMNVYLPAVKKDLFKNSLIYKGGQLWNRLPEWVKESPSLESFKSNYMKMYCDTNGGTIS